MCTFTVPSPFGWLCCFYICYLFAIVVLCCRPRGGVSQLIVNIFCGRAACLFYRNNSKMITLASGIGVVTMEARWRSTTNISHWIFRIFWFFRVLTKYGKSGKYGKPIILFAISPCSPRGYNLLIMKRLHKLNKHSLITLLSILRTSVGQPVSHRIMSVEEDYANCFFYCFNISKVAMRRSRLF